MFACIGWGSLIWDPRSLPINSEWFEDGPTLPLEFTRQSNDGRMTLVIDRDGPECRCLWATLNVATLQDALVALQAREGVPTLDPIGRVPQPLDHPFADRIEGWRSAKNLSGVVWTALQPKFAGRFSRPSLNEVVEYLCGLSGASFERAREYVENAPAAVVTPYRRAIAEKLGWKIPS